MNTVGYIDVVGETKLIMLELAELQKENEQLRAELTTARADAIRECVNEARAVADTFAPLGIARKAVDEMIARMESLTKKEGDDGPTAKV